MKEYKYLFRDSDDSGFEEYDIVGAALEQLYNVCSKYCNVVSFIIANDQVNCYEELEQYRICKPKCIVHNQSIDKNIHYYRLCSGVLRIILKISNNMFGYICGWGYKNPEDPTFYRCDGSIFLKSEIHEGEIWLMPRNDEDVSKIVADSGWVKLDSYQSL